MSCGFLASFFAWSSDSLFCQGFFFHSFSRKLYSSPVLHESFAGVCFLKLEVLCSFFWYFGIENDICISIQIESKCTYSLSNIKCCYCCFWTFSVLLFQMEIFFSSKVYLEIRRAISSWASTKCKLYFFALFSFVRLIRFRKEASQKGLTLECKKRDFKKKKKKRLFPF